MALKKRSKVSAEFSMSSLTDIIFLLLIFFMLTSTLVSPNALNLKLPSSSSKTVAPQSMSISIDKEGTFYFNGKKTAFEDIEALMQTRLRDKNPKDVTVTILADKICPVEYVVKAMDLANKLKVNAILATEAS